MWNTFPLIIPFLRFLSDHLSIFLFLNYTITSIKYDSRNIIIPQYQYITYNPMHAPVFSIYFIVRLISIEECIQHIDSRIQHIDSNQFLWKSRFLWLIFKDLTFWWKDIVRDGPGSDSSVFYGEVITAFIYFMRKSSQQAYYRSHLLGRLPSFQERPYVRGHPSRSSYYH